MATSANGRTTTITAIAAHTTRRLRLASAMTATLIAKPASDARVEVSIKVAPRSVIATPRNHAVRDALLGIAINIPTARAAISASTSA